MNVHLLSGKVYELLHIKLVDHHEWGIASPAVPFWRLQGLSDQLLHAPATV
jgi:hypothetical protein